MSQILNRSIKSYVPNIEAGVAISTLTLNATGETCHFVGYIELENPLSGAKTLSSAGGGSIVWTSGAVTFADAGTTFEVGIQDVSTSASPSQGDGTFDVKASFTGGGGGVTGSSVQTSVMTSGTKSIAHNQLISITFAMTATGGSDSVSVNAMAQSVSNVAYSMPVLVNNTTGSYAISAGYVPIAYIVFDDGTIGWIHGTQFFSAASSVAINSGSATADEYGNIITLPFNFIASGVNIQINAASTSSDFEIILYSAPLGTPVAERTITIDATQLGVVAGGRNLAVNFSSAYNLSPNIAVCLAIRPTTANNVILFYCDTSAIGGRTGAASSYVYAANRLDNAGAFADYNSGTAKTRMMWLSLTGRYAEQGVNNASSQIGI